MNDPIPMGFSVGQLDSVPSTNDLVLSRIREGKASAGEVFVARRQPGARGRMGRQWSAPEGGLWLTAAMPLHGENPGWAGMLAALAVCQALDETGLRAGVKWPNDIVIGRKKLAGILVEVVAGRELAAVGIGMNVRNRLPGVGRRVKGVGCRVDRTDRADRTDRSLLDPTPDTPHPTPSPWPPTSVAREIGHDIAPGALLSPILARLGERWGQWAAGRLAEIREAWSARDACRGYRVRLLPDGPEGVADGIDASGALRVRLADGTLQSAIAGELVFLEQGVPEGGAKLQE